jgi:pimeloyl-ACP methyl ester carboxylesterase
MEKWIAFEKGKINYSVQGEGPVIVLLHGFLEDHTIWDDFARKLAARYKVIAIDLPGFGKTSNFNKIHTMPYMANTVYSVLADEFVEECIMVGHSMGGYVALAFAMNYPDKLKGLILFHSQAAADTEEGKVNRDRTIEIVEGDHHSFIHSFVPSLFAESNVKKYEAEINRLRKISLETKTNGIVAALAGMRDRPDFVEMLSKLEIPVFFIIGKQDSRINMEMMLGQLKAPHNCEAMILDNVGHMGFIEASDITYLAIEHFVERNISLPS